MKRISLIIIAGLLFFSTLALGQEVYKWVDEKGTVHFTDDPGQIPEKYRDQVQKREPPKEPVFAPPTSSRPVETPKRTESDKEAESAPIRKDILGRGEDWWRATAKEWNEKYMTAQKNYESAYGGWKSKESELEASKFKPDSVKRKLKAEMKVLEEKAKDWEKKTEEAKNMLEKVLPKQAEDYGANPDWLKIGEKK